MGFDCILCDKKVNQKHEEVTGTPCGHMFHKSCIHEHIVDNDNCPRCNAYCHVSILFQVYCNLNEAEEAEDRENLRLQNELLVHRMSQLKNQIKTKDLKFEHLFKMVEQISETMKYFDNNNNEMIQENKDLQEAIDFMRPKSSNQNGDNKLIAGYSFASGELFEPTSELGYDQ